MKVIKKYILSIIIILISGNAQSNEIAAKKWLDTEISNIIELYRNENIDKKTKLNAIQNAINQSFAGNGIARFVAGNSWTKSNLKTELIIPVFHIGIGKFRFAIYSWRFEFWKLRLK